jgi:hypothetical protein
MKKIAILLIALIATATVSFAAPYYTHDIDSWPTYGTQAVQEQVVTSNNDGVVPGLYSTYSIDNTLVDYNSFDSNTNLEGFLAQLDQAHVDASAGDTQLANI